MATINQGLRRCPDPLPASVLLRLALELEAGGRPGMAEEKYREILALEPRQPDALNRYGVLALRTRRPDLAVTLLRRAVSVRPAFAAAYDNLGAAYASMRRFADAVGAFVLAIAFDPRAANAHKNLGNARLQMGLLDEAETSLRRALALQPDCAEAEHDLAVVLASSAFSGARAAHAAESSSASTRHGERLEEARAHLARVVEARPHWLEARLSLAIVQRNLSDVAGSERTLRAAIAIHPRFAAAHRELGVTLARAGRMREARAVTERAHLLAPDVEQDLRQGAEIPLRGVA